MISYRVDVSYTRMGTITGYYIIEAESEKEAAELAEDTWGCGKDALREDFEIMDEDDFTIRKVTAIPDIAVVNPNQLSLDVN